ncbi:MAG: hypothetical protein OHK0013_08730 [Sandaracinaceae bacterium]
MRARSRAAAAAVVCLALTGPFTLAETARADARVGFGQSVTVATDEVVDEVASFGGDVSIDGEVRGDVASFGGDVVLGPHARVHGDVATMGGALVRDPSAVVVGAVHQVGGSHAAPPAWNGWHPSPRWQASPAVEVERPDPSSGWFMQGARNMIESLLAHGLLFLLALVLSSLFPERMSAMHKAIIREPLRSGALGIGSYVAAVVLIIALAITVLGIPAAVVLAFGVPLATYVGLAACATVIGAAIPAQSLNDRPILRLASGVGVLWVCSLVPFVGPLLVAIVACIGVGALVRTRFRTEAPRELDRGSLTGS